MNSKSTGCPRPVDNRCSLWTTQLAAAFAGADEVLSAAFAAGFDSDLVSLLVSDFVSELLAAAGEVAVEPLRLSVR